MEEPREDTRVTAGFIEDCKTLINKFEECDDIRFQDFCEVWHSMKFSAIFTGRQSYVEMLEFCEDALQDAKSFLKPPCRFKTQIGCLYLLYALYYKQPCEDVKIRFTYSEWKELKELHNTLKTGNHVDANYVLSKMIYDDAFVHTAYENEYGFEKYLRSKGIQFANPYSLIPALNDTVEQKRLFSRIGKIGDFYNQARCMPTNEIPEKAREKFDVTAYTDFVKELKSLRDRRIPVKNHSSDDYYYPAWKDQSSDEKSKIAYMTCSTDNVRENLGQEYDSDSSEDDVIKIQPLESCSPDPTDRLDKSSDSSN